MNSTGTDREQNKPDQLDQLDELLRHFRPIEKLFQLMGAVDPDAFGGGALVRVCSEIGLNLSAQFRDSLERTFRRNEDV